MKTPLILMIIDGFGYREETENNAIAHASTPNWDQLWQNYPHTLLDCSGEIVGLPTGQMGNSEVGHMHIGAGRQVAQDLLRIDHVVTQNKLSQNHIIKQGLQQAAQQALHIFGLLSPGGVHSSEAHIFHLIEQAIECGVEHIYLHAFLDGRDTPPKSAQASLETAQALLAKSKHGRIVSLIGRYYAMDRDKRWERTKQAYDLVTRGQAEFQADDAIAGLHHAYARGETDEFVQATRIGERVVINDSDTIMYMNFRADRARQLTAAFIDPKFDAFQREYAPNVYFISLTQYASDLDTAIAFPNQAPKNCLGEYIAQQNLQQLRIAETEKYAHVTFFINGGVEKAYRKEDRILVPSPNVATYNLKPEMSAPELADQLITRMAKKHYDLVILNFANADMVGHSGDFDATIKAIECIDTCLGRILNDIDGDVELLITADHGNAEMMFDKATQQVHTAHTKNPVPFLYVGREAEFTDTGSLQDIAPTILYLLGLPKPQEMTGHNLIILKS